MMPSYGLTLLLTIMQCKQAPGHVQLLDSPPAHLPAPSKHIHEHRFQEQVEPPQTAIPIANVV